MPSVASQPFRRITTLLLLVMPSVSLHAHHQSCIHSLIQPINQLFLHQSIESFRQRQHCLLQCWSCCRPPCMHTIIHSFPFVRASEMCLPLRPVTYKPESIPVWIAHTPSSWAARYNTGLLIECTPKGIVSSFLFFQTRHQPDCSKWPTVSCTFAPSMHSLIHSLRGSTVPNRAISLPACICDFPHCRAAESSALT